MGRASGCDHFHAPHERSVAMRTRAFRPEVPNCLEERSLLSGVARLSAHPVVLTHRRLGKVVEQTHVAFLLFARDVEVNHLGDELYDLMVMIPFGRVDGLGVEINRILDRMNHDVSARVPHAVISAQHDVLAATRAQVQARVRAGDVVVR
jgi:hypothetical protein